MSVRRNRYLHLQFLRCFVTGAEAVDTGVGPLRVTGVERFDDGAVGFDQVDAPRCVASAAESFAVFPTVMGAAQRECVVLIGGTIVGGPLVDVVDVAELGRDAAASVAAPHGKELCGLTCFAGEESLLAAHVDDDVVSVDDDASDAAAQHCLHGNVGMDWSAGRRSAAPCCGVNQVGMLAVGVLDDSVEEAVTDQTVDTGVRVDNDVDEGFGAEPVGRSGGPGHEDVVYGIELALIGTAWKRVVEGIVTMELAAGFAVGLKLGVDGVVEDGFHLRCSEWVAA